jgi:hypothetical protein
MLVTVPQSNTSGLVENTKVFEITMLKELEKTAVVISGEDLPALYFRGQAAAKELRRLVTKNTALCKIAR